MLIFIIASLIPVHLLCLPVASIDDRQLYLGIFPSFKDFNSSLEIFFNFVLVISELSAYVLAFPCSRTALPSPCYRYHVALLTASLWHAPEIKCKWGKLQSEARWIGHNRIPNRKGQWACKCRYTKTIPPCPVTVHPCSSLIIYSRSQKLGKSLTDRFINYCHA